MTYDIPTPLRVADLDDIQLPSSEEEWSAETEDKWEMLRNNSGTSPPTPTFRAAFQQLFEDYTDDTIRYSEFGGYITISGLLLAVLDANRLSRVPTMAPNFEKIDLALETWQRIWRADPKSHLAGPSGPFGAISFNAASVYRAACIRRIRNFSR
jgi:hypothetical protein